MVVIERGKPTEANLKELPEGTIKKENFTMYILTMWTRWENEVRHAFFKTKQEAIDFMKEDFDATLKIVSEIEWSDFYSDRHTSAIVTNGDDSYFWQIDKMEF